MANNLEMCVVLQEFRWLYAEYQIFRYYNQVNNNSHSKIVDGLIIHVVNYVVTWYQ